MAQFVKKINNNDADGLSPLAQQSQEIPMTEGDHAQQVTLQVINCLKVVILFIIGFILLQQLLKKLFGGAS